ncbi:hypothetical protein K1T71_009075 [Dendrolimus kikuchii]|uniref:Uncharacterized protein n=1 Tax=Dendrolimus kikuchii TaxID=765133 RepID=A0ACC1CTG0_9NEOP|nr:hypothetical protein K1T71_009075 [Dendrolimus kikuchii]
MSHFGDFMDGVPVKISEKYKRPPKIELPYSLHECPPRAQHVVDNVKFCSAFEKNVLGKLKELRSAKETKKNERCHRLQLLEEAKQKKLDAIAAAEEEERLKQLSVSEVSYPSTDEISALSPDDKQHKTCDTNIDNTENANVTDVILPCINTTTESQLNILQPIQVKSNYPENSLLDDPDPLQALKLNTKINRIQYNRNVETLTFRDFENDTSSPFDNVELKTINDMELLAQVLESQRGSTASCNPQPVIGQPYSVPNCASQAQIEGITYLPNSYVEQPIQGPSLMYTSPQHYPHGYYIQDTENVNLYTPNYQYYVPNNYGNIESNYYSNEMPTTSVEAQQIQNGSTYIQQPYYFQNPYNVTQYQAPYVPNDTKETTTAPQTVTKSRSRSVPDIVKELNDELAMVKLRANERSYNVSPAPKSEPQPVVIEKKVERRRKKSEQLPNPFEKLSPKLQQMCQKIHGMGFPLDRVARICTLIGDNDKKVIEGLLILGELMDLGFSEGRVSAALAKHEFNRDKALDELVS